MGVKDQTIAYESALERDFLLLLDIEPSVREVYGQLCQVRVRRRGAHGDVPYTPDVFVRCVDSL